MGTGPLAGSFQLRGGDLQGFRVARQERDRCAAFGEFARGRSSAASARPRDDHDLRDELSPSEACSAVASTSRRHEAWLILTAIDRPRRCREANARRLVRRDW